MACLWKKLIDKARMSWGKHCLHTAFRIKLNVENVAECSMATKNKKIENHQIRLSTTPVDSLLF